MKHRSRCSRRAIIGAEVVISFVLMAMLAVLSIDAVLRYRRAADEYFWRRAALTAADGQLQRYRAGASWDSLPPSDVLPAQVKLISHREPGTGLWQGMTRVTVGARVIVPGPREIREQLTEYLPTEVIR